YLGAVGADRFSLAVGKWTFIGINALMCGSGVPAEAEQSAWLDDELSRQAGQHLVLVMHKPLFRHRPDEDELHQGSLYPAPRAALRKILDRHGVRRIVSGHNHEFLHEVRDGLEFVWTPSTAFINNDGGPTRGGGE